MSYLDVPRLHFAGTFGANVSTVNNVADNYNPAVSPKNPVWNPDGTGAWTLAGCTVTSVMYGDGTTAATSGADPIVGAPVAGNSGTPAKLVDLDPEQQMVSQVWGLTITVGSGKSSVAGAFKPAAFADLWGRPGLSAYYQSILENLAWGGGTSSRFLQELNAASAKELSIKFVVDRFGRVGPGPSGRIVGTIGPQGRYEPDHFVAGRLLRSPSPQQGAPLYFAPCQVDKKRKVVVLDLGNSIPNNSMGGARDLGTLELAMLPAGQPPVSLGAIQYQSPTDYTQRAYIQEFPVSSAQITQLQSTPLGVIQTHTGQPDSGKALAAGPSVLLRENSDGSYVRADGFVFRMNPGDTAEVDLWATTFGAPASGKKITTRDRSTEVLPRGSSGPAVGVPANALKYARTTAATNRYGRASLKLTAGNPKNSRVFIDGQVYAVGYDFGDDEFPASFSNFVSVLVHDAFKVKQPVRYADVKDVLDQYAALYPYMTNNIVDLSSLDAIRNFPRGGPKGIAAIMSVPMTEPGFMPVTRDLSAGKTAAIVSWLEAGAPD